MSKSSPGGKFVKIYHGYGHMHDLLLYGHVFSKRVVVRKRYSSHMLANLRYLLRLFFVQPLAGAVVQLYWQNQVLQNKTETDGFIKFEWASNEPVAAGWHTVKVQYKDGEESITGTGALFVPHKTQYGFISDIDDTVMVSHSATVFKRLRVLFTTNPRTRKIFPDVQKHYQLLSVSNTTLEAPNPFFYVSSSEWNLYDYLEDFFSFNGLPKGAFLLNHIKRWTELLKTGKTTHEGKLIRVARILIAFPHQRFILIGDNTQRDPVIYKAIAEKYPERIHAVYIRNVHRRHEVATRELLLDLQNRTGVQTCLFTDSSEAIAHSKAIGLIV
ncbi:MAG: phosphatase domain-containing protein [Chitinophagaceae bacterium]